MSSKDNIDYEYLWEDEIAEQWIRDFAINNMQSNEVVVEITDPTGDIDPDSDEFEVKNVIFKIQVEGQKVDLWVFYDFLNEELNECESLSNQMLDSELIAKTIFEINERWKKEKVIKYLKQ
jgi:hypothetical protein